MPRTGRGQLAVGARREDRQPIGKELLGSPAPDQRRCLRHIVVRQIVLGEGGARSTRAIAQVLELQRVGVVLEVIEHVMRVAGSVGNEAEPTLRRVRQAGETTLPRHVVDLDLGTPRNRAGKGCSQAGRQWVSCIHYLLLEDARDFVRQDARSHAVERVERGESRPADVKRADDVACGPVVNAHEFAPIRDVLQGEMLERCAGHDQAVEPARQGRLVPSRIEPRRLVAGPIGWWQREHELDVAASGPEKARELDLGAGHVRHQVEEPDAECRAVPGPPVQHFDALVPQQCRGGKALGKDDGHSVVRLGYAFRVWTAAGRHPLLDRGSQLRPPWRLASSLPPPMPGRDRR
jgi:hypothetical protein